MDSDLITCRSHADHIQITTVESSCTRCMGSSSVTVIDIDSVIHTYVRKYVRRCKFVPVHITYYVNLDISTYICAYYLFYLLLPLNQTGFFVEHSGLECVSSHSLLC